MTVRADRNKPLAQAPLTAREANGTQDCIALDRVWRSQW